MESQQGLTAQQVERRRQAGQSNRAPQSATKTVGQIVRDNICTYFNLVFLVLAVMLALVGSWLNMGFLGIVFCNTIIGIFQQLRAKKTVDELTLVSARRVRCLRDGTWGEQLSEELVKDDVVEFGAGDQIVADAVVLSGTAQANESLLTGEANPITKTAGDALRSGSYLMAGRCVARLTRVGADSYANRLTAAAQAGVMVPVLSTHSTSTRASVSMQFISCVSTRRPARRIIPTASATLVSRYNPSGIIPISAATVLSTLLRILNASTQCCLYKSAAPTGISTMPMARISLSSERIISPLATLCPSACAAAVSRLA